MREPKKRISYRRGNKRIEVRVPASMVPTICAGCLKPAKRLNTHHWEELFTLKEVKATPVLALENSIQACVPEHRVANDLKEIAHLLEKEIITPVVVGRLIASMPRHMRTALLTLRPVFAAEE